MAHRIPAFRVASVDGQAHGGRVRCRVHEAEGQFLFARLSSGRDLDSRFGGSRAGQPAANGILRNEREEPGGGPAALRQAKGDAIIAVGRRDTDVFPSDSERKFVPDAHGGEVFEASYDQTITQPS